MRMLTDHSPVSRSRLSSEMRLSSVTTAVSLLVAGREALAGPVGYGICQAGCAGVVMACYSAAGFVWGVAPPVVPASLAACNAAFGGCQAACAAVALSPTP